MTISPICTAIVLLLQITATDPERQTVKDKERDIIALRDERAQLESRKESLQEQLKDMLEALETRKQADRAEQEFAKLKQSNPNYEATRERVEFYRRTAPKATRDAIEEGVRDLNKKIAETTEELRTNERDMYRATLIEKQRGSFMSMVSVIFSVLMLLIIASYFALLWRNPQVLDSVFKGPAGLQMITLLSVVIAIILFGITGVLEGKELSALLGGLTGYILGRVSNDSDGK